VLASSPAFVLHDIAILFFFFAAFHAAIILFSAALSPAR